MTASRRLQLQLLVLLVLLSVLSVAAYLHMARQQAAARDAVTQLAEARQLVQQIESLRDRPVLAGVQEMPPTDLAQLVEESAQKANLDVAQIVRIWPEPARRIGQSPYLEKPTQILLRNATLEQFTRFLAHVIQSPYRLRVSALRLSAPRDRDAAATGPDRWTAEVTLTYLLYAPVTEPAFTRK